MSTIVPTLFVAVLILLNDNMMVVHDVDYYDVRDTHAYEGRAEVQFLQSPQVSWGHHSQHPEPAQNHITHFLI